jgi:hypothetical protein
MGQLASFLAYAHAKHIVHRWVGCVPVACRYTHAQHGQDRCQRGSSQSQQAHITPSSLCRGRGPAAIFVSAAAKLPLARAPMQMLLLQGHQAGKHAAGTRWQQFCCSRRLC